MKTVLRRITDKLSDYNCELMPEYLSFYHEFFISEEDNNEERLYYRIVDKILFFPGSNRVFIFEDETRFEREVTNFLRVSAILWRRRFECTVFLNIMDEIKDAAGDNLERSPLFDSRVYFASYHRLKGSFYLLPSETDFMFPISFYYAFTRFTIRFLYNELDITNVTETSLDDIRDFISDILDDPYTYAKYLY
jgi:hypothetical protein